MKRRIFYTQLICALGAIVIMAIGGMAEMFWSLMLVVPWMVVHTLAFNRLRCVKCGEPLASVPPIWGRFFDLDKCAYCGMEQPCSPS